VKPKWGAKKGERGQALNGGAMAPGLPMVPPLHKIIENLLHI